MRFSQKWAHEVLKDRGIASPGHERIGTVVSALEPGRLQSIFELFKRIESGTEAVDEIDALRDLLSSVPELTVPGWTPRVPPMPNSTSVGPAELTRSTYAEVKPTRAKHHIYGQSAALTIELDELRATPDSGVARQTVMIEAAKAIGPMQFNWKQKIAFQCMQRELPLIACALLGKLKAPLALENHGTESNKSIVLTNQAQKIFVKVRQGSRELSVPVTAPDVHAWLQLVMRALSANTPEVGETMQLALLDRVADMLNQAQ